MRDSKLSRDTYAGFKIKQGQLSLDINYQLVDNKIQGKNKIVMNQLQLGESVESQKAIDLPLRLACLLYTSRCV